jgi:hypothetical protein
MAMNRLLCIVGCALAGSITVLTGPSVTARQVTPTGPRGEESAGHQGVVFETSDDCLACHNGLVAPGGEDVSIGVAWRASMMAHSSRDPYWQASVRRETIDHPAQAAAIEDECATCHMPMARAAARARGRPGEVFRLIPGAAGTDEHRLAADGVSCTLCHQIGPERLGTPASFNGGFVIGPMLNGARRMFGPYEVDRGLSTVMRSAAGVLPTRADDIRSSELCATCHTLYTDALGPDGRVVGTLPEQVPYLEWRHSRFANEKSCQSCHMPAVESTPIASVLGEPRDHLARHTFIGGNAFMLDLLDTYRRALAVVAPADELRAAAAATRRQLERDTAAVAVEHAAVIDGALQIDVLVRNKTGHKLPTGYPSRRVWLHVDVRDPRGRSLFESGALASSGAIVGNDNDADPSSVEPHYQQIERSDQVQIYESVMADRAGRVTTGLLHATQYAKDNRLLPAGFDKTTAHRDVAVHGGAERDPDFTGDGDRVRYSIPVSGSTGPLAISIHLRFQPIGFRWADNLRGYDADEPRRFVGYYDAMATSSASLLGHVTAIVK